MKTVILAKEKISHKEVKITLAGKLRGGHVCSHIDTLNSQNTITNYEFRRFYHDIFETEKLGISEVAH